ncbi:MAG: 2-oxoglutarate-dependent dioxygenase [Sinobacteraceae bacterium]|nr:2-oxoglutarate-dependent dioxygenase [Nevskiaceae bacterium]
MTAPASFTDHPFTDELRQWALAEIAAARAPDEVLRELIARGIPEEIAVDELTRLLESRLAELKQPREPVPHADIHPVPEPLTPETPNLIRVDGREISVLLQLKHPRVIVFGNLLGQDECDKLVALAKPRISASSVIDMQSGGNRQDAGRTSSGMAFRRGETKLIERIERRIAALLQWPYENGEALQILRYAVGQEYKPHYDYVDPTQPGALPFLARGGQRVASLVMYLNTPPRGGATNFPDVGLEVAAVKGNAVFFSYDRAEPSTRTLHGGMPVTAGEKWVATKWLRVSRTDP